MKRHDTSKYQSLLIQVVFPNGSDSLFPTQPEMAALNKCHLVWGSKSQLKLCGPQEIYYYYKRKADDFELRERRHQRLRRAFYPLPFSSQRSNQSIMATPFYVLCKYHLGVSGYHPAVGLSMNMSSLRNSLFLTLTGKGDYPPSPLFPPQEVSLPSFSLVSHILFYKCSPFYFRI